MKAAVMALFLGVVLATPSGAGEVIFASGFETAEDFAGFYVTPKAGEETTTAQRLTTEAPFRGKAAHEAWITQQGQVDGPRWQNRNHRAYPTVQLYKRPAGAPATPLCISLAVWVDADLRPKRAGARDDDWLSLATFTSDASDRWRRTVLVNLSHDGLVHLMHVPRQGQRMPLFQAQAPRLAQRQWTTLQVELDFGARATATVWMDGHLMSHARVEGMSDRLAQAHFGLYAPPQLAAGRVRNDALDITAGRCPAPLPRP